MGPGLGVRVVYPVPGSLIHVPELGSSWGTPMGASDKGGWGQIHALPGSLGQMGPLVGSAGVLGTGHPHPPPSVGDPGPWAPGAHTLPRPP